MDVSMTFIGWKRFASNFLQVNKTEAREREREKKERSLQPEAAILLDAITRAISESDRINLLHLHRR